MRTHKRKTLKHLTLIAFLASILMMPANLAAEKAKVDICHGTGSGKGITLNVAPEGAYNGHIPNHSSDTVGACAVEDVGATYNNNSSGSGFDSPSFKIEEFRETP